MRRASAPAVTGHDELEVSLAERTTELQRANEGLRREVLEREAAQTELGALWQTEQETREREARALRAEKLESLGVMAGGIAHDLSNLLTLILGQTSLALEDLSPEHRARPTLERAAAATRRAADVAQQLFVYAGLGSFEVCELRLNDLIRENVGLFRAALPGSIELRSDLAEELPWIDADPGQMQQVVMNLILNAAEAMGPAGGTVTLSTGTVYLRGDEPGLAIYTTDPLAPGTYVTLTVEDTGTGMDAESLAKIFDPFFTAKAGGRGLGLATVLGVLRAHRGGLKVQSEEGKGTAFRLFFPEARGTTPMEANL